VTAYHEKRFAVSAPGTQQYRDGWDGVFGTADDTLFETIAQVDAIAYVGPAALERLREFAALNDYLPGDDEITVEYLAAAPHIEVRYSLDSGVTWSEPYLVSGPISETCWSPVALASGERLVWKETLVITEALRSAVSVATMLITTDGASVVQEEK